MGNDVSHTSPTTSYHAPSSNNYGSQAKSSQNLKSTTANLTPDEKIINILLLGETGVGKSTFINSIVNYLSFQSFEKAEKDNLIVLIPTSFTTYDKDDNVQRLEIGDKHVNENNTVGASVTQLIRTYTFSIKDGHMLRLIDTPGLGDTRGPQQDEQNCEYILNYISNLKSLHAICLLLRPQTSRVTVQFRYCITAILSRLEKSACDNLIFIYTDSKDFTPGETYSILKKLAEDIKKAPPHAQIPIDKNKFCFDNEVFKYLAAKQRGVQFAMDIRPIMITSWQKSTEQCWKLIDYISKLTPHNVRNTAAINECRRVIYQLSQPMAEIAQNIDDNLYMLQRHQDHLKVDEDSMEELKKKLYVPIVDLEVKELSKPVTVCTESKCSEMFKIGERTKWHYKARCHNPCYLTNVTKDIIGDPALVGCYAMTAPNQCCAECGCHYKQHMHVYYESTTVQKEKVDERVQKNINSKEAILTQARKVIDDIKKKRNELEDELNIIIRCNAKFAYFLQNNAITPINDCYEEYIKHLITAESRLGSEGDSSKLDSLNQLLREHNQIKASFLKAQEDRKKMGNTLAVVTPEDIQSSVEDLYKLQHNGSTIQKMYNAQNQSRETEYLDSEYVHQGEFDRQQRNNSVPVQDSGSNNNDSNRGKQQQNRGRSQQRGNRGVRGGRGNSNPRQGPKRNEAPPTYNQSWRDFGREGRGPPRNQYPDHQRGQSQNRNYPSAPQRGRGGRQYSQDFGQRKNSSPNIQVNVTVPPENIQTSARGKNQQSSNYRYEYSTNNAQSGRDYQNNRNTQPRNDNYYRGQTDYQERGDNFPQDYPPSRHDYPSRESFGTGNKTSNDQYYSRAHPAEQDNYPTGHEFPSSNLSYDHYSRDGNIPKNNYTSGTDYRQNHNAAPSYYTSRDNHGYPSTNCPQGHVNPNPQQRTEYDSFRNFSTEPLKTYTSNKEPAQEYPSRSEQLYFETISPSTDPRIVQECPSRSAEHVVYDNYRHQVQDHPAAGSIVIEEYPRSRAYAPRNQPNKNEFTQRSEYTEERVNYHPAPRDYHRQPTELNPVREPQEYRNTAPKPNYGREHLQPEKDYYGTNPASSAQNRFYPLKDAFYGNSGSEHPSGENNDVQTRGYGNDPRQKEIREEFGSKPYPKLSVSDYPEYTKESRGYNDSRKTFPNEGIAVIDNLLKRTEINEYPQAEYRRGYPGRSVDNFQPDVELGKTECPPRQTNFHERDSDNHTLPSREYSLNNHHLEPTRNEYPPQEVNVYPRDGKNYTTSSSHPPSREYSLNNPHLEPNRKEYQPSREYTKSDGYSSTAVENIHSDYPPKNINEPPHIRKEYETNIYSKDVERPSRESSFRNNVPKSEGSPANPELAHQIRNEGKSGLECSREQGTTSIETHPENPFQTFEFQPHTPRQNPSRSTHAPLSEEDLISFDYQHNEPRSKNYQPSGTRGYPEEFGKLDNPVRVISPPGNYGLGEHSQKFSEAYQQHRSGADYQTMKKIHQDYQRKEYPVDQHQYGEYPQKDQRYDVHEAHP